MCKKLEIGVFYKYFILFFLSLYAMRIPTFRTLSERIFYVIHYHDQFNWCKGTPAYQHTKGAHRGGGCERARAPPPRVSHKKMFFFVQAVHLGWGAPSGQKYACKIWWRSVEFWPPSSPLNVVRDAPNRIKNEILNRINDYHIATGRYYMFLALMKVDWNSIFLLIIQFFPILESHDNVKFALPIPIWRMKPFFGSLQWILFLTLFESVPYGL